MNGVWNKYYNTQCMGEGKLEKKSFLNIWSRNRSRGLIHDNEKEEKFYETLKPLLQEL